MRALDLALAACRKQQSPRTGFVHISDTIPLYENFCFVLALFRQKRTETVLEGKALLERLLFFQTEEGNFPIYLHDYPKTWDRLLPLKIAPILFWIERDFHTVLNREFLEKVREVRLRLLACVERAFAERPLPPLWQMRLAACLGQKAFSTAETAEEWFEWAVSAQLLDREVSLPIPYSRSLQAFVGERDVQEGFEPGPATIEWLLAEEDGFTGRLLGDHLNQIYAALLFPFVSSWKEAETPSLFLSRKGGGFRLLWREGVLLHSLFSPTGVVGEEILFEIGDSSQEVSLYCSRASSLFVERKKATVFRLGERVSIRTASLQVDLLFELLEGEGTFCGQILCANRPGQLGDDVYDWKIYLREVSCSSNCTLQLRLEYEPALLPLHADRCRHRAPPP